MTKIHDNIHMSFFFLHGLVYRAAAAAAAAVYSVPSICSASISADEGLLAPLSDVLEPPAAAPSLLSASISFFRRTSISSSFFFNACAVCFRSSCRTLMYSIALSTVAAFEFALFPSAVFGLSFSSSSSAPFSAAAGVAPLLLARALPGNSVCISFNASLILFLRPCSAILCEVRLEVRPEERDSGYETPGKEVPSRRCV